jgi:hypothetical protein
LSHWPHYNFHYPCNYHNTYYFVILLSHCHIICLVIPPIVELLVLSWLSLLGTWSCNFHYPSNYLTYNWCFWHKIIHKRCSWKKDLKKIWCFAKDVENQTPNLWKNIYCLKLLQIPNNKRFTLHISSSTVEILNFWILNWLIFFNK